jgi:superfamily II DNA or RNA helicase
MNDADRMSTQPQALTPWQERIVTVLVDEERRGSMRGHLLAVDCGLGKTAVALHLCGREKKNTVIMMPKNLKKQWKEEFAKFLDPTSMRCMRKPKPEQLTRLTLTDQMDDHDRANTVVLIPTSQITSAKKDNTYPRELMKWLCKSKPDCRKRLIWDEAHLNGKGTKLYSWMAELRKKCPSLLMYLLTGTPIENHPKELIHLMSLIDDSAFPRQGPDTVASMQLNYTQYTMTEARAEFPGFVQLDKDFPDLLVIPVELAACQYERIQQLQRTRNGNQLMCYNDTRMLSTAPCVYDMTKMNSSTRRRQEYTACDTRDAKQLLDDINNAWKRMMGRPLPDATDLRNEVEQKVATFRDQVNPQSLQQDWLPPQEVAPDVIEDWLKWPKVGKLVDMLQEPDNRLCNAIVFCYWKEEVAFLKEVLTNTLGALGDHVLTFTGDDDQSAREMVVAQSRLCNARVILVVTVYVGGTGLNLQHFNLIFFTSPSFKPTDEIQAVARSHRMGQKRQVRAFMFAASNTIEVARIHEIRESKRRAIEGNRQATSAEERVNVAFGKCPQ